MVFGMSLGTYTAIHVVISLLGLATGFVALFGLVTGKWFEGWNRWFLATTIATSVTGFGFPFDRLLPSHIVGIISLIVLGIAVTARYRQLNGPWRRTYSVTACIALYLNVFVAVAQSFQKVPALKSLAPTQSEAPFLFAQLVALAAFLFLGFLAARGSHPWEAITPEA